MGLSDAARDAARRLTSEEYVRVVARRDADGLAAAAVLAVALDREGVDFHATFSFDLDDALLARLAEERPAVLLALGVGAERAAELARLAGALVLVEDADPDGPVPDAAVLAPEAAGHAGEPAVASFALVVARAVSKRNADLAGLALAGARAARGPPASLRGLDAELHAEAAAEGRLARGPVLAAGPALLETLAGGVEPVVPGLAGRARGAKRFLEELGIDAAAAPAALAPEARARLADALVRRALAAGAGAAVADALLEPALVAPQGPLAGLPLREVAALLAAAAEEAPADALAHALGRGPAPAAREDPARALHGLLTAARVGDAALAEAPSPALLAETARRLHALDPSRPAVAWAAAGDDVLLRSAGLGGDALVPAARAVGGRGAGSATRARARLPAARRDEALKTLGGPRP